MFFVEKKLMDIDLIFVNVNKSKEIEKLKKLREMGYVQEIVIYSKKIDFAIDGYNIDALNYMKEDNLSCYTSLASNELANVLGRAIIKQEKRNKESIVVTCAKESRYILLDEIIYFEVKSRIMTVHYVKNKAFEFYSTMRKLEEQFFNKGFVRTHKSFMVNKKHVLKLETNQVILSGGHTLPIGRKYKKHVIDTLFLKGDDGK